MSNTGFGTVERGVLLSKNLTYAFSLEVNFDIHGLGKAGEFATFGATYGTYPMVAKRGATFQVQQEALVRLPDGRVHDVVRAEVYKGNGALTVRACADAVDFTAGLVLRTDTTEWLGARLAGVVTLPPSPGAGDAMSGTAFISMISETLSSKYRWLTYNQLLGFGRVSASVHPEDDTKMVIAMTFDMYLAG